MLMKKMLGWRLRRQGECTPGRKFNCFERFNQSCLRHLHRSAEQVALFKVVLTVYFVCRHYAVLKNWRKAKNLKFMIVLIASSYRTCSTNNKLTEAQMRPYMCKTALCLPHLIDCVNSNHNWPVGCVCSLPVHLFSDSIKPQFACHDCFTCWYGRHVECKHFHLTWCTARRHCFPVSLSLLERNDRDGLSCISQSTDGVSCKNWKCCMHARAKH